MAWSPESSPKSHKTNGLAKVPNGPVRGDVSSWSKFDQKWRFLSSKIDEKTCMKLRILAFSNNDFSDRFGQNHTFCYWFAPVFEKLVIQNWLSKSRCSAQSALLPRPEAKLSKYTHCTLTLKKPVFDDKSWTRTRFVFANKNDGFSKVTRFKAFGENHGDSRVKSSKILHATQAKLTTTKGPLSAHPVLPAQGWEFWWSKSRTSVLPAQGKWHLWGTPQATLINLTNNNIY